MTKKLKKKTESVASLKRNFAAMKRVADKLRQQMDNANNLARSRKEQIITLEELLGRANENLQAAKIENAELHGYINRVEIEDDVAWHNKHGVTFGEGEGKYAQPPLRQRIHGAHFEDHHPNDMYHTPGGGRPARTRFAG